MADNRTMAQLLQAPTEGYEDAIVIPEINANFELKHDTFLQCIDANDQDSLNFAAGGIFLDKMPRECLRIIESKSKVRNSQNKAVVVKVSSNSSTPGISPDVAALTTEFSELKNTMKTMLIDKQKAKLLTHHLQAVDQITNPREHVNAITTRSGKTCEGPSTPLVPTSVVSTPLKEPEQNLETSMDKVQKPSSESTAQVLPPEDHDSIFIEIPKAKKIVQEPISPEPNSYQPKLPYPERMKVREKDKPSAQQSRRDELVFYAEKSEKSKNKQFAHTIFVIDFSKDKPFSGSTTIHSDALPPSSSFGNDDSILKKDVQDENFRVYSNPLFEFDDNFTSSNVNPLFDEMVEDVVNKNSKVSNSNKLVLLNTPLSDKVECFDPGDNIDEIDAFLAMEVSSNFEDGYYDSKGDVIFLENLLSDDTTHNLPPDVIFDHEPKPNESIHNSSITFSPRNDPLHHEFAREIITNPTRITREHEEYLSLMALLCEISTS
ncbi:hypothetical protein Tco_0150050 [Tanacetum coccineum]